MLKQLFKDPEVAPTDEAFIDGVPVAILAWQESPLRAATSNPQDSFEETTAITSGSEPYVCAVSQNGQNLLPLVIG